MTVAAAASPPAAAPRYEIRADHDPNGIGKFYLGREIARVTGAAGIGWLDRPEREETEPRSKVIEALELKDGEVVADLGAGSGYYSFALASAVGPKGTVLAVEIQEAMLAALRRRAAERNATNVGLIRGTPQDPRLPAGRVDLVLMVDVYHELEFPYEVMTKVVQALKPGGRVALIEYRAEDPEVPVKAVHKMTEEQIRKEMEALGLEHVQTVDSLTWQHLVIFKKGVPSAGLRRLSPRASAASVHHVSSPPPPPALSSGGGTESAVIVTEDRVAPPGPVQSSV